MDDPGIFFCMSHLQCPKSETQHGPKNMRHWWDALANNLIGQVTLHLQYYKRHTATEERASQIGLQGIKTGLENLVLWWLASLAFERKVSGSRLVSAPIQGGAILL